MIKTKIGGIVLTGLAGYLILSKGLGAVERCVKNVCVAKQWKNYYKYGKDGNMVPPGYYKHTVTDADGGTVEFGDNRAVKENKAKEAQKKASQTPSTGSFGASIAKAISDAFIDVMKDKMATEDDSEHAERSEAGSEGSEEGDSDEDLKDAQGTDESCQENRPLDKAMKLLEYVQDCRDKGMDNEQIALSLGEDEVSLKRMILEAQETLAKEDKREDAEIEAVGVEDILVNGVDPGDPDGISKTADEETDK